MNSHIIEEMTDEDKDLLIRGFRTLDLDGNGVVSSDEVYQYLMGQGLSHIDASKKTKKMMKVMDPENKGEISLDNYIRSKTLSTVQQHLGSPSEIHLKGLEVLDPENTGKIDALMLETKLVSSASKEEANKFMIHVAHKIDNKGQVTYNYQESQAKLKVLSVNPVLEEAERENSNTNTNTNTGNMDKKAGTLDGKVMQSVNLLNPPSVSVNAGTSDNNNSANTGNYLSGRKVEHGQQATMSATISQSGMDSIMGLAQELADEYYGDETMQSQAV